MEYGEFMRDIHTYFQKARPPKETIDLWKSEVGNYPVEFYGWAYQSMKCREKEWPKNLPNAVKELWQEWLNRNPGKRETHEFRCRQKHCKGGLIYVVKDRQSWVYRCGECNCRDDLPRYPIATLHSLELDGYQVDSVENTLKRKAEYDPKKWGKVGKGEWVSMVTIDKLAKEFIRKEGNV